jgi:hypothetical protein
VSGDIPAFMQPEIQVRFLGGNKKPNERVKMKELMNELKATVSRTERFLIYGLGIFTAVGTVTVLIGIINQ